MPAPKYYCDYCDKQFDDTPSARRRHLAGPLHQRAKKQWFDSFKDEDQTRGQGQGAPRALVCNQFSRTGFCSFGEQCRYAHLVPNPWPAVPMLPAARPENHLPPSLQPPREDYSHLPPVEWG